MKRDELPYLEYRIMSDDPVDAVQLADAFKSMQGIYRSSLYSTEGLLGNFDETLYVGGVREGSQIYELVSVAAAGALQFVPEINASVAFFKNIKGFVDYFSREAEAPKKITPKHCTQIIGTVSPGINSGNGVQFNVTQGNLNIEKLTLHVSPEKAEKIVSNAIREKILLQAPQIEFYKNQVLKFIQANAVKTSTSGTISADKGIILDIDAAGHSVIFDDSLSHEKSKLLGDNNFYTSTFLVDVEVARSNKRIKAYIIKRIKLLP